MFQSLWAKWDLFWFKPRSTTAISLYRIVFGVLLLIYAIVYLPSELPVFWGESRAISRNTVSTWWQYPLLDLLLFWPKGEGGMNAWYAVFIVASLSLAVGFLTRASAFVVWIWLLSMHHDTFIYANGSDVLMRLSAFYLIFSYAGSKYSIDARLFAQSNSGLQTASTVAKPPWAQRLFQLQLSAIYFQCFWTKLFGTVWLDGSAVYYILKMDHYKHVDLSIISSQMWLCQMLSWFTLATELSLFTLIWFKRTRKFALLLGVAFHIGIDIAMNLPMFEYFFVAIYLLFLDDDDWNRITNFFARISKRKLIEPKAA